MTTGYKVDDRMTPTPTDSGLGNVGIRTIRTWNGADDPGKHAKENYYHCTISVVSDAVIKWRFTPNGRDYTGTYANTYGGVTADQCAFDSNDDNALVNKLGDEIRGHSFNAASSLGAEGHDALKQIIGAATTLRQGFRALGNIKADRLPDWEQIRKSFGVSYQEAKRKGLHKDLSDRVLATQLGWIPLMGDLKSASEALHAITKGPIGFTYKATKMKTGYCHPATDVGTNCGTAKRSKRVVWTLSEQLSAAESLAITNPWDYLNMAWNATRLSFIADWFLPVGSYLRARSVANVMRGTGYTVEYYRASASKPSPGPGRYLISGNEYFWKGIEVTRTPITSLSGLTALPSIKDFNKIPNWQRALTAVTLAAQSFF